VNEIEKYYSGLSEERRLIVQKLMKVISENLPEGFSQEMSYGFPSFVVSLKDYPSGYHCKKETALPFISIGSQKNFIAVYHMGIYSNPALFEWFEKEYPKHCKTKLDMGKSCIRFKNINKIPFELIAQLAQQMTVKQWIDIYENR
jgi:uncharacterized protein YdhG (YjbR/CyaY superfamily)